MNSAASHRFHLVWYISGHGFGHASRCSLLLKHLLLPATSPGDASPQLADCSVEVVTFAPAHLFTNLVDTCGHRFTLRRPICRLDAGVIQKDPVTMDVALSIAEAQAFVANDYARLVSDEVARLASLTHTLDSRQLVILSDASFAPAQIAQELLVPSLLCTNFTWDSIYLSMLQHPPSLPPPAWIQSMTQSYSLFTHWLLESGQLPWPTTLCSAYSPPIPLAPPTTHIPVFGRTASAHITPALLRAQFGIPATSKLALVTFGGHETKALLGSVRLQCPGWTFVGAVEHEDIVGLDPATIQVPEWMHAADVVIGKVGYGTCTEVLLANRPFLYLKRAHWAEEKPLLAMMGEYGAVVKEFDVDVFKSGMWGPVLDEINVAKSEGNEPVDRGIGGGEVVFWETVSGVLKEWASSPSHH